MALIKSRRYKLLIAAIVALFTIPGSIYVVYFLPGFNDLLLTDFYSYGVSIAIACGYAFLLGVILRLLCDRGKS